MQAEALDKALDLTRFEAKLRKALSYEPGVSSFEGLAREIESGDAQLWLQGDGLVVTQIRETESGNALNYWLAAGDMDDVLALTDDIEEWARDEMDCKTAYVTGRRGWTRILPDYGWSAEPTVNFRKEL